MGEPSKKQLSYLRLLALKTGVSFTHPKTRSEASREIKRLRNTKVRSDLAEVIE